MKIRVLAAWLLDIAVISSPSISQAFALGYPLRSPFKTAHEKGGLMVLRTLKSLQERGFIYFHFITPSEEDDVVLEPSLKDLVQLPPAELRYSLTAAGGELWEQIALPKWSKFGRIDYHLVHTTDRFRVCEAYSVDVAIWMFRSILNCELSVSEVVQLEPWKATYWKTLDCGWRVSGYCNSLEVGESSHSLEMNDSARYYWKERGFDRESKCHMEDDIEL